MISPGDIIAAKLLVQLRWVPIEAARHTLETVASAPGYGVDFLTQLEVMGLALTHVKQIRRYVARFQFAFHEAAFLRELERHGFSHDKACQLLAGIEMQPSLRRLGDVLLEQGQLSEEELWEVEETTRRNVYA